MKKRKYAIVGISGRSRSFTGSILNEFATKAEIVALLDRNAKRMEIFNEENGLDLPMYGDDEFDKMVDEFVGSDSTVMFRDQNAWMFKEVDAPLLGWEVYARKDRFYRETGVALVADATKLAAQGIDPTEVDAYPETPLFYALEDFLDNNVFGPYEPAASYRIGFEATVAAIRVNEAVMSGTPVVIEPSAYELG